MKLEEGAAYAYHSDATNRLFAYNGRGELTAGIGYLGTNVASQAAPLPECHPACDGSFTRKNEP